MPKFVPLMELKDVVCVACFIGSLQIVIRRGIGLPFVDDEFELLADSDLNLCAEESISDSIALDFSCPCSLRLSEFSKDFDSFDLTKVKLACV